MIRMTWEEDNSEADGCTQYKSPNLLIFLHRIQVKCPTITWHRIIKIYHLFVSLLTNDIKSGLGGAWAFVLRDVIYTLIHYINQR